ncbi:MAG TPA: hypothetical protein VGR69_10920 [Candidatus Rubrimentiphilum sp.]|nr:hypothetical protein [Candidatus Rubrimentiphilum sp.]
MKTNTTKQSLTLGLVAALVLAAPVGAAQSAPPRTAAAVISRIAARNPSLHSFETRVHVQIHMTSFPWLSPHLDGTAYYKSPDKYEIVFDHVPSYAHGIDRLFGDIGDAIGWQRDWNVNYIGLQTIGGHPMIALTMTKKVRSDQIKEALAYVDPATYEVVRMEWHYFNGGHVVMTQTYREQGAYSVVASQHADISVPYARGVADSGYDRYATNVAVSDTVFTGGKK